MGHCTFMNENGCIAWLTMHWHVAHFYGMSCISKRHHSYTCLITAQLRLASPSLSRVQQSADDLPLRPHYARFICSDSDRDAYCVNLLSSESSITKYVNLYISNLTYCTSDVIYQHYTSDLKGVNAVVADFIEILTTAGKATFKQDIGSKRKEGKQRNQWFDKECSMLRGTVRKLQRQVTANPYSVGIRNAYRGKCKEYKNLLKRKQQQCRNALTSKLSTLARGTTQTPSGPYCQKCKMKREMKCKSSYPTTSAVGSGNTISEIWGLRTKTNIKIHVKS